MACQKFLKIMIMHIQALSVAQNIRVGQKNNVTSTPVASKSFLPFSRMKNFISESLEGN